MISALVSSAIGAFSAMLPEGLKMFSSWQESKAELKMLELTQQYDLKKEEIELRREQAQFERDQAKFKHTEEMNLQKSEHEQTMGDKDNEIRNIESFDKLLIEDETSHSERLKTIYANSQTKIEWINGFNALIRPVLASLAMILFLGINGWYIHELAQLKLDANDLLLALKQFWAIPLVEVAISGPLAFLFTARQVRKFSRHD